MRAMRKNILITGASSGLGEGMARQYGKLGRNLALCARRVERLEELKKELLAASPGIRVYVRSLDVTQYDQVFEVFRAFKQDLGSLDRIIVNAGIGRGQPVGTGNFFRANKQTAETNFVAALAQCEAAVEIFRAQNAGHLVTVSSMSALRGMRGNQTAYAASKAALASLSEGIRADLMRTPIRVSTIYPGYIRSEINAKVKNTPFIVDTETGCRAMVAAIEREVPEAYVPRWPWSALGFFMKRLPLSALARMT
jgi:short-subunit dehydrogenase